MPGYGGVQQANTAQNGNNVAAMIGSIVVAFAQTVGHQLGMGTEQLYGVGSAKPQEIQQLRTSPSVSLDFFTLSNPISDGRRECHCPSDIQAVKWK